MKFDEILLSIPGKPEEGTPIWSNGMAVCCETRAAAEAIAQLLQYALPDSMLMILEWPEDRNLWEEMHHQLAGGRDDDCAGWWGVCLKGGMI